MKDHSTWKITVRMSLVFIDFSSIYRIFVNLYAPISWDTERFAYLCVIDTYIYNYTSVISIQPVYIKDFLVPKDSAEIGDCRHINKTAEFYQNVAIYYWEVYSNIAKIAEEQGSVSQIPWTFWSLIFQYSRGLWSCCQRHRKAKWFEVGQTQVWNCNDRKEVTGMIAHSISRGSQFSERISRCVLREIL